MIRILSLSALLAAFLLGISPALAQNTTSSKPAKPKKSEISTCLKQVTEKEKMAMRDAKDLFKKAQEAYKMARAEYTKSLRASKTTSKTDAKACKEGKMMTKEPMATIQLAAQNNSGESGTATLKEKDGKVTVSLKLTGAPNIIQPAHIHMGSCAALGAIKYPLSFPVGGVSDTLLDVSLAQLKSEFPLAINVHASTTDAGTYVSCGDLTW